jgi:hypothetical protein
MSTRPHLRAPSTDPWCVLGDNSKSSQSCDADTNHTMTLSITRETPSMFIVQAEDDPVHCDNALLLFLALKQARAPLSELHVYPTGGHGFGLCSHGEDVCSWPKRAQMYLEQTRIIPGDPRVDPPPAIIHHDPRPTSPPEKSDDGDALAVAAAAERQKEEEEVKKKKKRPHILLIVADDYGWNDVGYHTDPTATGYHNSANPDGVPVTNAAAGVMKTPTIDRLASEGKKLENYYVQPLCSPTRSTIMVSDIDL